MDNNITSRLESLERRVTTLEGAKGDEAVSQSEQALPAAEILIIVNGARFGHVFDQQNEEDCSVDARAGLTFRAFRTRTRSTGVARVVLVVENSQSGKGWVQCSDLSMTAGSQAYGYPGRFVLPPGGRVVRSFYEGGSEDGYWRSLHHARGGGSVPSWAPLKLNGTIPIRENGPFLKTWDVEGNAAGGGGVGIYRHEWWNCPEGWARAAREIDGNAMKHRTAFYGKDGWDYVVDPGPSFALMERYAVPRGFGAPPFSEDLDWWPGVGEEFLEYPVDHQHLKRAFGSSSYLARVDPWARFHLVEVAKWALLKFSPHNHVDTGNHLYWDIDRMTQHARAHGPNEMLGRGFAWCYRLFRDAAYYSSAAARMQGRLNTLISLSMGENGAPFRNCNPLYAPWARKFEGAGDTEGLWMEHERHLLLGAIRNVPGMETEYEKILDFGGTQSGYKALSVDRRAGFGDPFPFFELGYGDLSRTGSWEAVLESAKNSPVDFTNIINHAPRRGWSQAL